MERYAIPLVPGPVAIAPEVLAVYAQNYGSGDLEDEFFALYRRCEAGLQEMLGTQNQVAILSGEGMMALWGAMKSVLRPGDRVLAVASGVFGYGFAEMAKQLGAEVETVGFGYDEVADPNRVREAALRFRPRLVTMVHCETPSGTLNPLHEIGEICREVDALYYVDFVASGGGAPVLVDENAIDLGLLGSQKVLSLMADLSMVTVSERAWKVIEATKYVGYDALAPWKKAVAKKYLPFTHNWQAMAGLEISLQQLFAEGLEHVYQRHTDVAAYCRERLVRMGLKLWVKQLEYAAPTVTAVEVPPAWSWEALNQALRAEGVGLGGNYGPLAGKVFRIGHMGTQANRELVARGLDVLERLLVAAPHRA